MDHIVRQKGFWSEDDETVLKAIKEGFIQTHQAMWKELRKFLNVSLVKLKVVHNTDTFSRFFSYFQLIGQKQHRDFQVQRVLQPASHLFVAAKSTPVTSATPPLSWVK